MVAGAKGFSHFAMAFYAFQGENELTVIHIKYQLKSARPTLVQLAFMVVASVFSFSVFLNPAGYGEKSLFPLLRPFPEVMPWIGLLGGLMFLGVFLISLQRHIVRQIPLEIETSGELVVKYENGKTDRIPYNKIFRCAVVGRESLLSPIVRFLLGPPLQLIVEVKPARILPMHERKLAEQICEDIISKIPKEEPDLSVHPHP